jgi:hypothetical protein
MGLPKVLLRLFCKGFISWKIEFMIGSKVRLEQDVGCKAQSLSVSA